MWPGLQDEKTTPNLILKGALPPSLPPPLPPFDREVLPACVKWHEEPLYEHLDMIWADTAKDVIFPEVMKLLEEYGG